MTLYSTIEVVCNALKHYAENPDLFSMCRDIANDLYKEDPAFDREAFMESCGFVITAARPSEDGRIFYNFKNGDSVIGAHLEEKHELYFEV